MFADSRVFSGFSVDNLARAQEFYRDTLGLRVTEVPDMGPLATLHLNGSRGEHEVLVYEKADHTPATFTILNFPVPDIEAAVEYLERNGVTLQRYDGFDQDEKGIARGQGPAIAWFTDPAGNVLSALEETGTPA